MAALLLCSLAYPADYLDGFDDYRRNIKIKLFGNSSNSTISDSTLNEMIRQSALYVLPIMHGPKAIDTFYTEYHQSTYTMDSLVGVLSVEWRSGSDLKTMLLVPRGEWYQKGIAPIQGKSGYEGRPSYYDVTDNQITLYPTPWKTGDTMVVVGFEKVTNIAGAADLDGIPQRYRVPVLLYASWLAARSLQNPMAVTWQEDYRDAIAYLAGIAFGASKP